MGLQIESFARRIIVLWFIFMVQTAKVVENETRWGFFCLQQIRVWPALLMREKNVPLVSLYNDFTVLCSELVYNECMFSTVRRKSMHSEKG